MLLIEFAVGPVRSVELGEIDETMHPVKLTRNGYEMVL
jgi:hypothetical protein